MVAPHTGFGKLSLITPDEVGAVDAACQPDLDILRPQDHRPGYHQMDCWALGRMGSPRSRAWSIGQHVLCDSTALAPHVGPYHSLLLKTRTVPHQCLAITFLMRFAQATISPWPTPRSRRISRTACEPWRATCQYTGELLIPQKLHQVGVSGHVLKVGARMRSSRSPLS